MFPGQFFCKRTIQCKWQTQIANCISNMKILFEKLMQIVFWNKRKCSNNRLIRSDAYCSMVDSFTKGYLRAWNIQNLNRCYEYMLRERKRRRKRRECRIKISKWNEVKGVLSILANASNSQGMKMFVWPDHQHAINAYKYLHWHRHHAKRTQQQSKKKCNLKASQSPQSYTCHAQSIPFKHGKWAS